MAAENESNVVETEIEPVWKWSIDANGYYTSSDDAVQDALGYASEDIIGRNLFDLVAEEDRDKYRAAVNEASRARRSVRCIISRHMSNTGETRTLESSLTPLIENNNVSGFVGISRGIVNELVLERIASEAMDNYRSALEHSPNGIFIMQGDLMVYANPSMKTITGYTLKEFQNTGPFIHIHPEEREKVREHYHRRMTGEDVPTRYDLRIINKAGEIVYLDMSADVITFNGAPAFLYNLLDITDRVQLEETRKQLSEVASSLDAVVYRLNADLTVALLAGAIGKLTGYSKNDYLGTDRWLQVMHPEDVGPIKNELQRIARSHLPGDVEYRVIHAKTGDLGWVHSKVVPDYDEHGELLGYDGVTVDITARKRAEEEKLAAQSHYRQALRSFYRETILSITSGKLVICDRKDVDPYITSADMSMDIACPEGAAAARRAIEKYCLESGLSVAATNSFVLAVGEAITNAIKHAERGTLYTGTRNGVAWTAVSDNGPGIESLLLPHVIFHKGFSTKPSMGLGYTIMLDIADHVLLLTGRSGTTVILEKNIHELEPGVSLDSLPDTW